MLCGSYPIWSCAQEASDPQTHSASTPCWTRWDVGFLCKNTDIQPVDMQTSPCCWDRHVGKESRSCSVLWIRLEFCWIQPLPSTVEVYVDLQFCSWKPREQISKDLGKPGQSFLFSSWTGSTTLLPSPLPKTHSHAKGLQQCQAYCKTGTITLLREASDLLKRTSLLLISI